MASVTLVVVLVIWDGKRLIVMCLARLPNAQNTRIRHVEVMAFASKILNVAASVALVGNHVRLALATVCLVQVVWMKKHCSQAYAPITVFAMQKTSAFAATAGKVHPAQRLSQIGRAQHAMKSHAPVMELAIYQINCASVTSAT